MDQLFLEKESTFRVITVDFLKAHVTCSPLQNLGSRFYPVFQEYDIYDIADE